MIVAGTTATFGYIIDWALRASYDGELVEVNPEETLLSRFATRLVREPAAVALPSIVDELPESVRFSVAAGVCAVPHLPSEQPTGAATWIYSLSLLIQRR